MVDAENKRQLRSLVFEHETALLRRLIWLYLILWLVEGGLRRWFLPGLATPLLLIRDPVAVAIYILAFQKNLFPVNGFIFGGCILAVLTFINAIALGHGNILVALYGVRCDFLHVPLIFIMARVLQPKHLMALSKIAVWIAIPYTFLLVAQFYAPQDAWVNRGLGGSLDGAGFSGDQDRFRPPGTFSFITGPTTLYPLLTACWFAAVLASQIPAWMMVGAGMAIMVALPISISRGLFLGVVFVAIFGVAALLVGGRLSGRIVFNAVLAAVLLPVLAFQLPAFKDGMEAFGNRWELATTDNGGVKDAIFGRVLDDLLEPFKGVGATGLGTGYSTNVGQKMLTNESGFGASEGEWGRLLFDNGLFLGIFVVGYRIALAGFIVITALQAWQQRSPLGLVFASAAFLLVLNSQWGQATSLGGAIIAGGLTLAASQLTSSPPAPAFELGPKRRRNRPTPARK